MGHESRIELWSPNLTAFCFAGFGTDRLRCEKAMKTAGRENPNHWAKVSSNRAHGAADQNRSCSIKWAAKQEKVRPLQGCFFLTFLFIELIRSWDRLAIATPGPQLFAILAVRLIQKRFGFSNERMGQHAGCPTALHVRRSLRWKRFRV